jgi:ligand-binding sensor domain-containing protein
MRANRFTVFAPDDPSARRVHVLFEDRAGQVWGGSDAGLFRIRFQDTAHRDLRFEPMPLELPSGKPVDRRVISLFEDSRGDLWIGTVTALYRRVRNGYVLEYRLKNTSVPVRKDELWNQILEDRQGRLWAATGDGFWRLQPDDRGDYRLVPVLVPRPYIIVWVWSKISPEPFGWELRADSSRVRAAAINAPQKLAGIPRRVACLIGI